MLIRAFQVQVRGHGDLRPVLRHAVVRHAGVEPHVEDVGDLLVVRRLVAEQVDRIECEPRVDAVLLDALGDRVEQLAERGCGSPVTR